ncbi:MAG: RluA family pseudouridine synthase [Gammaproteobacteria bacterium]|nr:RluA family pseudouridine synthase [Gammaproteobacteria bacterium]MCY4324087.1 RluA family pseudouridine synthase [Gammaproteobacteria bacterium]
MRVGIIAIKSSQVGQVASVPKALAACRLDRAASVLFPDYSRSLLTLWIREGRLTVDGRHESPKRKVREDERLCLRPDASRVETETAPEAMPLDIVYEDDDVLVIDKPAGLVVHPGAGNARGTLVSGLIYHRPALEALPRAGLVHRLDADTTGLLVVAASRFAHKALAHAIAARRITREYQAIVEGRMISGGDFDAPIGRHPTQRTRQAVREDGRSAQTSVRVTERFRAHSWLHARLHTGRMHQIRVHLSDAGFPLVGDRKYGARGILPKSPHDGLVPVMRGVTRHMLHAATLGFAHPRSGDDMTFDAPLPADMAQLLEALKIDAA